MVILGHSERRHIYGETDALVNKKVRLALAEGFEVILCVGETLEERQTGVTEKVVETQTRAGPCLGGGGATSARVTIAYEPVWAIGTGKNATPAGRGRGARVHPRGHRRAVQRAPRPRPWSSSTAAR